MAVVWLILQIVCWFCFFDRTNPPSFADDSQKCKHNRSDHSLQSKEKLSSKTFRHQYIRIEMFVLFLATFITYFNQTALETIVAAFTEKHFDWTTVHTSILFAFAGLEIILVYLSLVKFFSKRFEDRILLIAGTTSLTLACILGTFFTWGSYSWNWFGQSNTGVVNKQLMAMFIVFVILDLLGLPFIAATSVSLFTKLTTKELQGSSQGIQRFIMGIGTIGKYRSVRSSIQSFLFVVGPLFAASLLNRLHLMMTTMLVLISLTLISIIIVIKRLRPVSQQTPSKDLKDIPTNNHTHGSSVENTSTINANLPSKNCYVTLVQHDDEQQDCLLERRKSSSNRNHDDQGNLSKEIR